MPSPTPSSDSLEIPPLAMGLLYSLDPKDPREIILARQAAWAASHILNLIGDSPAEPDAKWLRLHNTADRILHRNLRLLDRLRAQRPTPAPAPTPVQASAPAPNQAKTPPPPAPTPSPAERPHPSRPDPSSHRRPNAFRRPRPHLDLGNVSAFQSMVPVAATPTPPV